MHLARLDLAHIQHIVDQGKQGLRGVPDIEGIIHHRHEIALRHTCRILSHDHFVHTHDCVDGRADLV